MDKTWLLRDNDLANFRVVCDGDSAHPEWGITNVNISHPNILGGALSVQIDLTRKLFETTARFNEAIVYKTPAHTLKISGHAQNIALPTAILKERPGLTHWPALIIDCRLYTAPMDGFAADLRLLESIPGTNDREMSITFPLLSRVGTFEYSMPRNMTVDDKSNYFWFFSEDSYNLRRVVDRMFAPHFAFQVITSPFERYAYFDPNFSVLFGDSATVEVDVEKVNLDEGGM